MSVYLTVRCVVQQRRRQAEARAFAEDEFQLEFYGDEHGDRRSPSPGFDEIDEEQYLSGR